MKKFYLITVLIASITLGGNATLLAQCGAGYTQAQLNWDNLDFYWNSGGSGPYENYISNTDQQSQKFAIGSNYLTIATSSSAMVAPGSGNSAENSTHTGDLTGYTGADVQFNPTANGQTVTITFNNEVMNASFSLYDIDGNGAINVAAVNALALPLTVNTSNVGGSLSITGLISKTATSGSGSDLANNVNNGSVTFTITGPVKTITITVNTIGSNPVFWLSDINACVTGSFPNNYNQSGNNQPFTGPAGNQPDYFIVTPDNNSVYMVDPATGNTRWLFTDAARTYVNSFGYDPYNRYLYYISENSSLDPTNKALKRYDFNTNTFSTIVANIYTTLGIPTMNAGVESAGAAFYDGAIYLGIEGGKYDPSSTSNDRTRETIIWRINLDASQNPTVAYQVFATDAYLNASNTSIHDWGDFVIKNGEIYDFNTARNGSNYAESKYHHYNLMTGNLDAVYNNPGTTSWNGQAALGWSGQLYYFRATSGSNSGIGTYDGAGNNSGTTTITVVGGGPAWPGGAGDASENFRPKCDFGDAPSSYDPNPVSPAVYERSDNLRLGATWGSEWVKTPSAAANTDPDEDGVFTVEPLDTGTFNYAVDINVFNNSGANATVGAWLDFNANGVFDASEYVSTTVGSSASTQNVTLIWWFVNTPLLIGQSTYMRIRITPTSKGMGASNATGYYEAGEVEDYQVQVDRVLPVSLLNFTAKAEGNSKVELNWRVENESKIGEYKVERSLDGVNWEPVGSVTATNQAGGHDYSYTDLSPLTGKSYYRLNMTSKLNGATEKYSDTRTVTIKSGFGVTVTPNPVKDKARVTVEVSRSGNATVKVISIRGEVLESREVNLRAGMNMVEYSNIYQYGSGAYILQVKTETETINKQFIIKHE